MQRSALIVSHQHHPRKGYPMTSIRATLRASGFVLHTRRLRLTNQERVETPPNLEEVTAIATHAKVPLDFRILAVHRLMDIACAAPEGERDRLWGKIGTVLQKELALDDIPPMVLRRFAGKVPFNGMRTWAYHHFNARRNAGRTQEMQTQLAA